MNLKCRINGVEYEALVQGTTFSDEYNETLDSGSVILDHIEEIKDLKPYDDVYIYEGEFNRSDVERRYYANLNVEKSSVRKVNNFQNVFYASEQNNSKAISESMNKIENGETQSFKFSTKIKMVQNNLALATVDINYSNCKFTINKNKWTLESSKPSFEYQIVDLTDDEVINKINEIPGLTTSGLNINFVLSTKENVNKEEYYQLYWEPVKNNENHFSEKVNGYYYFFEDTKIESEIENFSDLFDSSKIIQFQTKGEGLGIKKDLLITMKNDFDITKFQLVNNKISDNFNFTVTINRNNALGSMGRIVKTYDCYFMKDQNNVITLMGQIKGDNTNIGEHEFSDGVIISTVNETNEKYIIFERDEMLNDSNEWYTYSFDFDNIGFIFNDDNTNKKFYKHLLLDTYFKERINASPYLYNGKILYKYRLQLFSEAKRLETIQLPNISITQPVKFGNKKTKTVYYYIEQFVNMYSPRIKVDVGDNKWQYLNKYYLDPKLKEIFGNVYSPNFSLNNPNLRDVLKNLMLVKDQIPIVIDDMISCLDITERKGEFNEKGLLSVVSSLNSENYCDSLKRTYNNALSQENTCKSIEFLNFRNSDQALMTLDNMRLETRFPIYKINKIYMCYFKENKIANLKSDENGNVTFDIEGNQIYLCQQDITPLVKLNSERQLLKKDWNEFENNFEPETINDLSKYRMATIGYDIGSKYITGWGEKYNYIKKDLSWFKYDRTYIENILLLVDKINPYGDKDFFMLNSQDKEKIVIPGRIYEENNYSDFVNPFSNMSLGLKSLFFKIEYEGFYNGTIVHSKNNGYSDITINDNSSASLTLLEKDGLFQKEKINRFSNEQVTIQARYTDISDVQPLGSVYGDDIVIYHREISVFDNVILATYYGTKDYVLKNYFTTVFAKHRPYNLLPYEESVIRAENKKVFLNFSKEKLLYEKNKTFNFNLNNILNFLSANTNKNAVFSNELALKDEQINAGYMKINGEKYASDVNTFVSGNSLCLNMAMYDNVSGGVYIKDKEPDVSLMDANVKKDFTGSVQDWYITVDDVETGYLKNIGFYFSHNENGFSNQSFSKNFIKESFYEQIFKLPKINNEQNEEVNLISGEFELNKDNKELIDMTFQIEPISTTNDVFFSQWMMKLSNLLGVYQKIDTKIEIKDPIYVEKKWDILVNSTEYDFSVGSGLVPIVVRAFYPTLILKINKKIVDFLKEGTVLEKEFDFLFDENNLPSGATNWEAKIVLEYRLQLKNIKSLKKENEEIREIGINIIETIKTARSINDEPGESEETKINSKVMKFVLSDTFCGINLNETFEEIGEDKEDFCYFINMDFEYLDNNQNNPVVYKEEFEENLISTDDTEAKDLAFFATSNKRVSATDLLYYKNEETLIENVEKKEGTLTNYNVGGSEITSTHEKNMFIVLSDQPMKEHLVYDEYESISEVSGYVLTNYKVGDIISLNDDFGSYIKINLNGISSDEDYKSVQMWYYVDGSYKFVFGVNVTEKDKDIGEIKIYISTISNKDPRVFNSNGLLVGEVVNYLEDGNTKTYGEEQFFKKK